MPAMFDDLTNDMLAVVFAIPFIDALVCIDGNAVSVAMPVRLAAPLVDASDGAASLAAIKATVI